MTATHVPDSYGPDTPRRIETRIDMRCSASLERPTSEQGRCQLLAGHSGPHALMFGGRRSREVLVWTAGDRPGAAAADWMRLPWMRGYPSPAWFEAAGRSADPRHASDR